MPVLVLRSEPISLIQDIHLIKFGLRFRKIEDALYDCDKPYDGSSEPEREYASDNADGEHDETSLVAPEIKLVNTEHTEENRQ